MMVNFTEEQMALTDEVNHALQQVRMHVSQHRDGLQYGPIPGSDTYGIYNSSLLFLNAGNNSPLTTTCMILQPYNEETAERYGWTIPYARTAAFISNIQYGPLYGGTKNALNVPQVQRHLLHLRDNIRDTISTKLRLTPTPDMVNTYFALQMVSSSPGTDWHLQPLALNPYLQSFLHHGIHAPLIFAALGAPKHGTENYNRTTANEAPAPRFTAVEAGKLDNLNLALAMDLLNIKFFKKQLT